MSSLPTAYTPLESLLLFQALRAEGVESISFNKISERLKSIPLVTSDPAYDAGRLSPDALRQLYLDLLKQEVKRDLERQPDGEHGVVNGDVSPGSRKRKAPSPSLPTVHEAAQHSHLIPKLVERLYARYRQNAVNQIRDYEKRYDALQREVGEVEAGRWDERLQRQSTASATASPKPSTAAHTQGGVQRKDYAPTGLSATTSLTEPTRPSEAAAQVPPRPYAKSNIDSLMNHGPEPQTGHGGHRRTSSNTTLPPLSEMAPQSPRFGIPPRIPEPVTAPTWQRSQSQSHSYQPSPPTGHQSPYASHHGHPPSAMQSPQIQQSLSRPSSSPRPILPPPPGMKLPPPTPPQGYGSPGIHGPPAYPTHQQQHYQPAQPRMPTAHSPTHERTSRGLPPPHLPTQHSQPTYYPSHQQQPYQDRRTSYPQQPVQTPHAYPAQPPQPGGYMLPPFQVTPQEPARPQQQGAPQQQTPRPQQTPARRPAAYPQPLPPQQAPTTGPRPARPRGVVANIVDALATPARSSPKALWKSSNRPRLARSPEPPTDFIEPLSPVLQRAPSPPRQARATRQQQSETLEPPSSGPSKRSGRRPPRNVRGASVVSSTADGSARATRSQSVSSTLGAEAPVGERPVSRRRVKDEPSTPANDLSASAEPEPVLSSAQPTRRTRRGTLQSLHQPSIKRKRQESPDDAEPDEPPSRPTTVTATRNFAKMSQVIMNDINSHKHGSRFLLPVRDKDAEGYSEIIKQPQNLKSIRAAIVAGGRAISAATASQDSPSATPSTSTKHADGSTTVELERTEDLIPPKAIVNGAQLEKEVMRMFANAVMFNPGEDGMVADTREMFEDVEAKIREWRGAERDTGVAEEEEDAGKGKRRKL